MLARINPFAAAGVPGATTHPSPWTCAVRAAPTPSGTLAPTMGWAPSIPSAGEATCIDPLLPPQ